MANFPTTIFNGRQVANRAGVVYDSGKQQVFYAEDHNLLVDEVEAIETILGINPQGDWTSVADYLAGIEAWILTYASATDINTGTDEDKYINSKGLADSKYFKSDETKTLTNKTIDADNNTVSNIGLDEIKTEVLAASYPVGSIYINATDNTNPATLLGFGTWVAFGAGRVPVGYDASDTDFDTAEETGGAKTHTLTGAESGEKGHNHTQNSHNHTQNAHYHAGLHLIGPTGTNIGWGDRISTGANDSLTGGGATIYTSKATAVNQAETATNNAVSASNASSAHNNVQPYIVVHMWKRTA